MYKVLIRSISFILFILSAMILIPYTLWMMIFEVHMYSRLIVLPLILLLWISVFVFYCGIYKFITKRGILVLILGIIGVLIAIYNSRAVGFVPSMLICMVSCYAVTVYFPGSYVDRFGSWRIQAAAAAFFVFALIPLSNHAYFKGMYNHQHPIVAAKHLFYKINSNGFRGAFVSKERQDSKALRILFMGDSSTFGFLCSEQDSYPSLVGSKLSGLSDTPVEVINTGVCGFSLARMLKSLDDYMEYDPDLVFVMTGLHFHKSLTDSTMPDEHVDYNNHRPRYWMLPPLLYELKDMQRVYDGSFSEQYDLFRQLLCDLVEGVEAHNKKLVFLEYPSVRQHEYVRDLISGCVENNGLDQVALRDEVADREAVLFDQIHPSREGHDIISDKIVEYLLNSGRIEARM